MTSIQIGSDDPFTIVLKDSMSFLNTSLSNLVENLKKLGEVEFNNNQKKAFPNLWRYFCKNWKEPKKIPDSAFNLLLRKGVYPYKWVDSFEKFNHRKLPTRKAFKDDLNNKNISKEDYKHAMKVWSVFKIKDFKEYSNLYLE